MEASKTLITSPNDKALQNYIERDPSGPQITSDLYRIKCNDAAQALAMGLSIVGTAQRIGVARRTLQYWLDTAHFCALVQSKKDLWELEKLTRIEDAGANPHRWQANAWLLERVFKDKYAQPKAQGGAIGNVVIQVNVGSVPGSQDGQTPHIYLLLRTC